VLVFWENARLVSSRCRKGPLLENNRKRKEYEQWQQHKEQTPRARASDH
jgi:hypothetical protein